MFLTAFLLTYFGVEQFRRWSAKKRIYDVPNERSSHDAPKPRGGGLIFVLVSLVFYSVYTIVYKNDLEIIYIVGACMISLISWLDDLFSVSFVWRFIVHSFAAVLIIYDYGTLIGAYFPYLSESGIKSVEVIFTFCWIVWLTNAYNFMDGIDGIAALQAVIAGLGWFFAGKILGIDETAVFGGILAFSCAGFLIHNWQPAKIFMGDVGSAFLGYTFAVMPLLAKKEIKNESDVLSPVAIFLVWFFLFDSLYTFFRRLFKGKKVWKAHREHIYQRLVIRGHTHKYVAVLYGILSTFAGVSVVFWLYADRRYWWLLLTLFALASLLLLLYGRKETFEDSEKEDQSIKR